MERKYNTSLIDSYLKDNQDNMVKFLQDFIKIKSVTYEEKEAVEYAAAKMKEYGYDEVRIDDVGNVLGRIGNGQTTIVYDAHIDTVDLGDLSKWKHHPLSGEIEDGYIWGRGTVDDKGPLAAIIWAGKMLKDLDLLEGVTVWVSGSLSEEDVEGSCLEEMLKVNPDIKPDFLVVAEASEMQVIKGHKGRALIKVTVPGVAAHASVAFSGENALIKALPIIDGIDKLKDLGKDELLGEGTIEVTNVICKTPSNNTIPGEVVIYADRRLTCGETKEELLAELKPILDQVKGAEAVIDIESFNTWKGYEINAEDYFPSWIMDDDSHIILAGKSAYENCFNEKCNVGVWPFSTNATSLCGKYKVPAICFGPSVEELCHSEKERISIDDYLTSSKFYGILACEIGNK